MTEKPSEIKDILDQTTPAEPEKPKASKVSTEDSSARLQGHTLSLKDPDPWPEPVDGVELLTSMIQLLNRFMVLEGGCPEAVSLWAFHAHAIDAFCHSPRLAITSPEKQCGKTTLLDILTGIVPRPLPTANTTPAAIFRAIEFTKPTLLIDEADTFLHRSDELRGILNSGHRKATGFIIRNVGDEHEPRKFSTFAATAIALIGELPDTLADRSIPIRLRRRMQQEEIESFRAGRCPELLEICRKAIRWVNDHLESLSKADPVMPQGLYNRNADNWAPLLAIADKIGGEWPEKTRAIALELSQQTEAKESLGVMALADIRLIFSAQGVDKLASGKVLQEMKKLDGRPWAEDERRRELTPNVLARILRPFRLGTENMRVTDEKGAERVLKGFRREAFEPVWRQYLPPLPESEDKH